MGNTKNAADKPVYDDTYTFPQDSQDAVDYAELFAFVRGGTSAERQALPVGKRRIGLLWTETDTGGLYRVNASQNWAIVQLPDTGWQDLTPYSTGWTTEGTDTPQYRVLNGLLQFRGRIDATAGAGNLPFTNALPASARPSRDTPFLLGTTAGTAATFSIGIGANGVITVFKFGNVVNDLALAGAPGIPVG